MWCECYFIAQFTLPRVSFLSREIQGVLTRSKSFLLSTSSYLVLWLFQLFWWEFLYIKLPCRILVLSFLKGSGTYIVFVLQPSLLLFFIRSSGSTQTLLTSCSKWYCHYIVSRVFAIVLHDKIMLSELYWLKSTYGLCGGYGRLYFSLLALVAWRMRTFVVFAFQMVSLQKFVCSFSSRQWQSWHWSNLQVCKLSLWVCFVWRDSWWIFRVPFQ